MIFRGLLLSVALLAGGMGARAADPVYSIVTNPGEEASTRMNIGWHSDVGASNCFVLYTRKTDSAWTSATRMAGTSEYCDIFKGISSKTPAGADFKEEAVFLRWGAELANLEPDTPYMYKIGAEGGFFSPVHYFKTAGAEEFSFVWVGDFHTYTPLSNRLGNAVRVIEAAVKIDPGADFLFSTGDVVAWGGSYSFWRTLYEQDFIKDYMFANVLGNHDHMTRSGAKSSDYFRIVNHFPRNGYPGQQGVCYWFLYGRVLFLTLNNEVMANNPAEQAAAKDWAAGVIRRLRGKYRYVFLSEHYQWFDGRSGKTSWYANWKDFCDEHRVALALAGNNHIYERSHPLRHDQVVPDGEGTVYMAVPSADGERGVQAGRLTNNVEKLAFVYSSHAGSANGQVRTVGCVLVKVRPEGIATRLIYLDDDRTPQVADEHSARALTAAE